LLAATLGYVLTVPFLLGLAGPAPLVTLVVLAALAGVGTETFGILWETTFQQEIPEEKYSRVSSYDALGSFVLMPVGMALAGPVSAVIGIDETLWLSVAIFLTATAIIVAIPSVRAIRATPAPAPGEPTPTLP
jgi:MFS family permease